MKRRFYCLGSILRLKLTNTLPVIVACGVLHNLAIQNGDQWEEDEDEPDDDFEEPNLQGRSSDSLAKVYRNRISERIYANI
jgi:hypothetical protein